MRRMNTEFGVHDTNGVFALTALGRRFGEAIEREEAVTTQRDTAPLGYFV